jgi:hypothetical protein
LFRKIKKARRLTEKIRKSSFNFRISANSALAEGLAVELTMIGLRWLQASATGWKSSSMKSQKRPPDFDVETWVATLRRHDR